MSKKVLILGGTGMLGHVLFSQMSLRKDLDVYATVRSSNDLFKWFSKDLMKKIRVDVDADNFDTIIRAFAAIQPNIVINCIGLVKQEPLIGDPLSAITINSLLPHRISMICRSAGARLIHISTDCVFDGEKGSYTEEDLASANDVYGKSKFLGEVAYPPHCLTLRTSIIGHELRKKLGLVEWFLAQKGKINGFTHAIYSGFPTIELARIITDYIFPNENIIGVYHLSTDPISKYDLLKLIAEKYAKKVVIEKYDDFYRDLSLNSSAFQQISGYTPPSWARLIDEMHQNYISAPCYKAPYEREV